jgi:hypothetical protein
VCGKKLINDTSGRGVENLDSAALVTVNDAVLPYAQAPQPVKVPLKWPYVAKPGRQTEDSDFHTSTGLWRKHPLVVAHLISNDNFSPQEKKPDRILPYRNEGA